MQIAAHVQSNYYDRNFIQNLNENLTSLSFSEIFLFALKQAKKVEISEVLKKICVSPPYFAFQEIYRYDSFLIAPINPQQVIEFESTPMSSAEAGRHLAILGSCSLAIDEVEKNYYLAHKALKKIGSDFKDTEKLYVVAYPNLSQNEKGSTSSAYTALVNQKGDIIFEMDILFQKVSVRLFNRIFKEHLRETQSIDYNPYEKVVRLVNITENNYGIKAELPLMSDSECSGHFDGAPMLPVGTMSYIITNHIGTFLRKVDGQENARYSLLSADLELFEPTNIRKREFVEINYGGKTDNVHNISWVVRGESGKERNRMQLFFTQK